MPHRHQPRTQSCYATGVIAGEVADLAAGGALPSEIKIAPAGEVRTRDGRTYSFDPAVLAARFAADGIDIPLDLDHATSRRAALGERADAVGWIKALAARPDGLYATRIDWLAEGQAVLAARTHRYVSPTFHHTETGAATWMHSVALVTAPALAMPAVADASGAIEESTVPKAIALALGLAETADDAACLSAIAALGAAKVDKAVHEQALATLAAVSTELDTIKAVGRKVRVETLIGDALKAKKIVPAQRSAFEAMCATDEGVAQVEAMLLVTPAGLAASGLDHREVPDDAGDAETPVALAGRAIAYRARLAAEGVQISAADAVIAVKGGAK